MADNTARKPILNEVATVEKDIDLFYGWTSRMENPDQVLRYESAGQGVKLYEELERDWQVFAMLQTRSLALQACEWQVEPASDKRADKKIAEFIEQVFKEANFDRLTDCLMQAALTGYKPAEVMWEASEGDIWVREFRGRRPSRFVFDVYGNLRLLTPQNMTDGEPVPDRKFVTWSFGGHDWNPYGRGLGYHCYWPVWFKKNGVKFWVVFCEKFGSPTPVGKYPPGTSEGDKATLLDALAAVQQETGIRIPDTMAIEYLEAKRAGDSSYEQLCEYMDRAVAKIILGQTLTSDSGDKGSGSYALGQVHNEVRRDLLKADADSLCETINNTAVKWLVDYNFPRQSAGGMAGAYPKVWRRTEPEEDLKALADRDKILLVDLGMKDRVPESYIEDTYGLPLAKAGDATIGLRGEDVGANDGSPAAPKNDEKAKDEQPTGFADSPSRRVTDSPRLDSGDRAAIAGQSNLEALGDAAIGAATDQLEALLQPVLAWIEGAQSLEEIGERLYEFYPQLDSRRFQELLARAMLAAGLTGYRAASGGNA